MEFKPRDNVVKADSISDAAKFHECNLHKRLEIRRHPQQSRHWFEHNPQQSNRVVCVCSSSWSHVSRIQLLDVCGRFSARCHCPRATHSILLAPRICLYANVCAASRNGAYHVSSHKTCSYITCQPHILLKFVCPTHWDSFFAPLGPCVEWQKPSFRIFRTGVFLGVLRTGRAIQFTPFPFSMWADWFACIHTNVHLKWGFCMGRCFLHAANPVALPIPAKFKHKLERRWAREFHRIRRVWRRVKKWHLYGTDAIEWLHSAKSQYIVCE